MRHASGHRTRRLPVMQFADFGRLQTTHYALTKPSAHSTEVLLGRAVTHEKTSEPGYAHPPRPNTVITTIVRSLICHDRHECSVRPYLKTIPLIASAESYWSFMLSRRPVR